MWVSNWKPPPKRRRLLIIQADFQAFGHAVDTTSAGRTLNLRDCFFLLLLWFQQRCRAVPTARIVERIHWLEQDCALAQPCIRRVSRGKKNNEAINISSFFQVPLQTLKNLGASSPGFHFSRVVWDASVAVGSRLLTVFFSLYKKFTTSFGHRKTENVHTEVQKG